MTPSIRHRETSRGKDDGSVVRGKGDSVSTDERVHVGLVGLGRMGRLHAANFAGRIPGAQLVRIVDADEKVARKNSEKLGGVEWSTAYADLIGDQEIDAVLVASPTPLHADMVAAAAAAGKHVFCEKPISLDLERTYGIVETVRSAGVKIQVGFHRRFDPDYRAARETISGGDIGDVYLFRTTLRDMSSPGFDYIKGSGGFFADVTLHDFDAARWLVGEIREVTAFGAALSDPGFKEVGDTDNVVVVLRFESGALGVIDNSRVAGYGFECSSEIMGSRGTLRIDNHRRVAMQTLTPDRMCQDYVSDFIERFTDAYREEMEHFVRAIRDGKDPEVGGAAAAAAFVLSCAAARSYREGKTVRLTSDTTDDQVFYKEDD